MVTTKDVEGFGDHLNDLSCNYKLVFDSMKKLKRESAFKSLIKLSEEYLKNGTDRLERLKDACTVFANEYSTFCENYTTKVTSIEEEDQNEIEVDVVSGLPVLEFKNQKDKILFGENKNLQH